MKRFEYKIHELKLISENVIYLNLVPANKNKTVNFKPGQYGLVSFSRGNVISQERPFSFVSSPIDESSLQFGFKIFGEFTHEFSQLKEGDSVYVRGPYGSFIFNERKHKNTVFLSAGIGITPFISIFRYAAQKKLENKLTLLYSNKTLEETPFYEEIQQLEKANPNFKALFTLTSKEGKIPTGFSAGRINEDIILEAINGKFYDKTFFICGPELFTDTMIETLKKLGVKEKNIKTEGFTLAPKSFFEKGSWAFPATISASAMLMVLGLYSVYQMESAQALEKTLNKQTALEQKITEITNLNEKINDHKNDLLAEQKANTKTVIVNVPQTRQIASSTIPQSSTVPQQSSPPQQTTAPKPAPTISSTPATAPAPTPAPAPKPAPKPRTTQS